MPNASRQPGRITAACALSLNVAAQATSGSVGVDLGLLPMAAVAREEIHGGVAGGRFGSGASAGVIKRADPVRADVGQLRGPPW